MFEKKKQAGSGLAEFFRSFILVDERFFCSVGRFGRERRAVAWPGARLRRAGRRCAAAAAATSPRRTQPDAPGPSHAPRQPHRVRSC